MAVEVSTFISYSRTDTDFVDRLEADLRARGFKTWVDRRRLEVGREWKQQIDRAIANNQVMMSGSRYAKRLDSEYVRHEYESAYKLGDKHIVTVLYKKCKKIPSVLGQQQCADFTNPKTYAKMVKELIYACQDSYRPGWQTTQHSTARQLHSRPAD